MSEPTDIKSRQKPPPKPRSTPCTVPLRLYFPTLAQFHHMPAAANDP